MRLLYVLYGVFWAFQVAIARRIRFLAASCLTIAPANDAFLAVVFSGLAYDGGAIRRLFTRIVLGFAFIGMPERRAFRRNMGKVFMVYRSDC